MLRAPPAPRQAVEADPWLGTGRASPPSSRATGAGPPGPRGDTRRTIHDSGRRSRDRASSGGRAPTASPDHDGYTRAVGAVDTMDTFFELLNAGDREAAVQLM